MTQNDEVKIAVVARLPDLVSHNAEKRGLILNQILLNRIKKFLASERISFFILFSEGDNFVNSTENNFYKCSAASFESYLKSQGRKFPPFTPIYDLISNDIMEFVESSDDKWDKFDIKLFLSETHRDQQSTEYLKKHNIIPIQQLESKVDAKELRVMILKTIHFYLKNNCNRIMVAVDNDGTLYNNLLSLIQSETILNKNIIHSILYFLDNIKELVGETVEILSMTARSKASDRSLPQGHYHSVQTIAQTAKKQGLNLFTDLEKTYSYPVHQDVRGRSIKFTPKLLHLLQLAQDKKININQTVLVLLDDNYEMEIDFSRVQEIKAILAREFDCYVVLVPVVASDVAKYLTDEVQAALHKLQVAQRTYFSIFNAISIPGRNEPNAKAVIESKI